MNERVRVCVISDMEDIRHTSQVGGSNMIGGVGVGVGGVPNHSNNVHRRGRSSRITMHSLMSETLPLDEAARLEMKSLPSKTPVSVLQELLSRRGTAPKYELVQIEGAIHEPTFRYRVTVVDVVGESFIIDITTETVFCFIIIILVLSSFQ